MDIVTLGELQLHLSGSSVQSIVGPRPLSSLQTQKERVFNMLSARSCGSSVIFLACHHGQVSRGETVSQGVLRRALESKQQAEFMVT
jgi:hypothetical protein